MLKSNAHLIQDLIPVLEMLVNKIGTEYPQKKVLDQLTPDSELKKIEVGITECRVIDCIEKNKPINAMRISSKMNISKSGISKIMSKLKKKELVNSHYKEGTHKEVYYTLTPIGKRVYILHDELYTKIREKYISMLSDYSDEELLCISKFLQDALKTL
jgi:DNA-binding MarR family transcriptional regulator